MTKKLVDQIGIEHVFESSPTRIISLVPSVFLTLFELTCIVTVGTEPNHWWCYAFAWVLAAFIIIYCIFIVIISLISLFTYNNAIDNVKMEEIGLPEPPLPFLRSLSSFLF